MTYGFQLIEIADFLAERGLEYPSVESEKEPVTFDVLLTTWELENTNPRTRRTRCRYMKRFAEHLGHSDATQVRSENFVAYKEKLLKQANAGEIAHKSVENILAGIRRCSAQASNTRKSRRTRPKGSVSSQKVADDQDARLQHQAG